MSYLLKISDVENASRSDLKKTIREILTHMKQKKTRDSYSNYAPQLDFSRSNSRKAVGEACGEIWKFCYENELPMLNLLIVGSTDSLPGQGIRKWYEYLYGSLLAHLDKEFSQKEIELVSF